MKTPPNTSKKYLWRFTRSAGVSDATWQDRPIWDMLEVVAETSGEAVLFAARHERRVLALPEGVDPQNIGKSGFEIPALYTLQRIKTAPSETAVGTVISEVRSPGRKDS